MIMRMGHMTLIKKILRQNVDYLVHDHNYKNVVHYIVVDVNKSNVLIILISQ